MSAVMGIRARRLFLALVLIQALHSLEEYRFALYEVFAPARLVSSLVSDDRAFGFALVNAGIVAFGIWCYLARVRRNAPSASFFAWAWVAVELANGFGHAAFAIARGGYFPGVVSGLGLLAVGTALARELTRTGPMPERTQA